MLYYKALTQGLNDLPAADAEVRAELEADAARDGWPALHARLARSIRKQRRGSRRTTRSASSARSKCSC